MNNQIIAQDVIERKFDDETVLEWVVGAPGMVEAFELHLVQQDLSPATVKLYTCGARDFQAWFERTTGQVFTPVLVTPLDARMWRDDLITRVAAATVNAYLAGFRAFCAWAQATGKAEHNPATDVKGVKINPEAPGWLARQEQYALLRAVEQQVQLGELRARGVQDAPGAIWPKRDRAVVTLLLGAGLRLSEAVALNVADVEIRPRSGQVTVRKGKGRKARVVPLNNDVRKALRSWLAVRPEEAGKALFVSQKGNRLSKRALARKVTSLGDKAGLDGLHPHTLRHCCAKNLVDAGVGIERVAMILGHSSLETTRRYTMPSQADLQAAVESVNWGGE